MPTQTKSHRIDPTAVAEDEIATLTNATVTLPIDKIRRDGGTQIRLQIDTAKVTEYAEMIGAGIITVHGLVFYDGSDYWLGDGFHRCAGLIELKRTHAHVEVRAGTRRDAVLYAATQANNTHGLPLTKEDRRNAALTLLRDKDWSAWTDREIGRRVGLSHPTVAKLRVQVEAERRRNAAAPERAGNETEPEKRKYMRNGQIQEMAVENIGNTPTTRQLVATWLDQRSSNPAARRVLVQQLIDNANLSRPTAAGRLLLRSLLQYLPGIDSTDDVLPHLRAELAKLEETAIVNGETYQQITIDAAAAAPTESAIQPGEDKTKITKHCHRCNAPAPWSPEDGMHVCSQCGHAIGSSYWPEDEKAQPTPLTVNEAAAVIAKYLNRKASYPQRQRQLLNASDVSTYTPHLLESRTLDAETFLTAAAQIRAQLDRRIAASQPKPGKTTYTEPAHTASTDEDEDTDEATPVDGKHLLTNADWNFIGNEKDQWKAINLSTGQRTDWCDSITAADRAAAELSKTPATTATNDDTNTAASHQQAPLSQSDGRGAGGEGLSAASFTTVSAFAGHVAVNHTEEIATEAWNTPEAALAAAQRGEAKPKHYKALQALQAKKEEEPEEDNYQTNLKRQDAATLRKAVDSARQQLDRLACTVAGQTLGQPFERLHADIVTKLRSLQTLLNDQYPKEEHES